MQKEYPANIKTAGGSTASYVQQASLELGRALITLLDVGLGDILKGSHPDLWSLQNHTHATAYK